jgi:hypothetical protein
VERSDPALLVSARERIYAEDRPDLRLILGEGGDDAR